VIVTAEGQEISNGEPGAVPDGGGRRAEGDLLAERRARRVAESGEATLQRRAETAEATVQTLETHVASLQLRLEEAEEERRRVGALLSAEQASLAEREHELRRAKQREYAEQQLRIEAEDRRIGADREGRAEIERLGRRLSAGEREARELARRLESVQRELAETEQGVVAERAAVRNAERELKERLSDLERRAIEIGRGLDSERAARERAERLLANMRDGHRRVREIVAELRGVILRLSGPAPGSSADPPAPRQPRAPLSDPVEEARIETGEEGEIDAGDETVRREEMAAALAAAVQRLRARAEELPPEQLSPEEQPPEPQPSEERSPEQQLPPPARRQPPHKHSMSLIARLRAARKLRRERR
jgi:chromosome segregation ATPase